MKRKIRERTGGRTYINDNVVHIELIRMVTLFDELSDLWLIEIFSYLSSVDALWSFNNLNTRLTSSLTERGFHRCVNLSSIRRSRFRTFLSLLRLNEIESLLIDCNASSLQVRVWPYLPHLTKLTVKGLRDPVDLFRFVKRQRHTLKHLTIHSSDYSKTVSAFWKDLIKKSKFSTFVIIS